MEVDANYLKLVVPVNANNIKIHGQNVNISFQPDLFHRWPFIQAEDIWWSRTGSSLQLAESQRAQSAIWYSLRMDKIIKSWVLFLDQSSIQRSLGHFKFHQLKIIDLWEMIRSCRINISFSFHIMVGVIWQQFKLDWKQDKVSEYLLPTWNQLSIQNDGPRTNNTHSGQLNVYCRNCVCWYAPTLSMGDLVTLLAIAIRAGLCLIGI